MLSLIVAATPNGVIGDNNQLVWHVPSDLKYFKETTLNKTVVMGKNTHLSIGRPLPNRRNHVISSTFSSAPNIEVYKSPHDWIIANMELIESRTEEAVVIGGKQIYEHFLPTVEKIYYTVIEKDVDPKKYDTKIFTVNDLLYTGQWSTETVDKIDDENSYFKSDAEKTPLAQTRYVLTKKHEFQLITSADEGLWFLGEKFGGKNKQTFEYYESLDYNDDKYFGKEWRLNGEFHRTDGPAFENSYSKTWCLHGKEHREDGPAYENADGHNRWYLNGRRIYDDSMFLKLKTNYIVLERNIPTGHTFGNLELTAAKLLTATGTVFVVDNLPGLEIGEGNG
jgi:dihydrofolate reductase